MKELSTQTNNQAGIIKEKAASPPTLARQAAVYKHSKEDVT